MLQQGAPVYPLNAEVYVWIHLLEKPAQEGHKRLTTFEMPHAIHASAFCCKNEGNMSHCNPRM